MMPRLSYPGERPAMNLTAKSSTIKLVHPRPDSNGAGHAAIKPTDPWDQGVRASDVPVSNGADHSAAPAPLEPNIAAIKNHLHVLFHEFAHRYQDALIEIAHSDPGADHDVNRAQ